MIRLLGRTLLGLLLLSLLLAALLKWRYGGGAPFPDRSGEARLPASALETVASLDYPPGNLAVSAAGSVYFTYHPEARPPLNLLRLTPAGPEPWPGPEWQPGGTHPQALVEVLSIRIDRQNRLWALDNGKHGLRPGRLLAFDLADGNLVHSFTFPRDLAGFGSHLNDFQVSPDGATIYLADASFFAQDPALLVYDVSSGTARRVLTDHESVHPEHYLPVVQGRPMEAFGLVTIRPGVDSIALSRDGDWLYFAPITNNYMYRVATRHLRDPALTAAEVARRVQRYALKTMSDGLSSDAAGNIYISDLEHSAILRLRPDRSLETLVRDDRLRWPDGFSFGPAGALYVSCSSLHQIIGKGPGAVAANAPYHIYRLPLAADATPGH